VNGDKKLNVTVQLEPETLAKVDERAGRLDLNRSQYLRRLVKKELGLLAPELGQPMVANSQTQEVPA